MRPPESRLTANQPTTRFHLARTACDARTTKPIKSGPAYLVDTFPSENGNHVRVFNTIGLPIPAGEYTLIVSVDDPDSAEVEAFSTQLVTMTHPEAPAPVPSFALRAEPGGFTINWQPSPSSNAVDRRRALQNAPATHRDHAYHGAAARLGPELGRLGLRTTWCNAMRI